MILSNESGVERLMGIPAATVALERIAGFRPSRATMFRWALSGRLKCTRIGGRLFTTESALRAMLAQDSLAGTSRRPKESSISERGKAAAARLSRAHPTTHAEKGG